MQSAVEVEKLQNTKLIIPRAQITCFQHNIDDPIGTLYLEVKCLCNPDTYKQYTVEFPDIEELRVKADKYDQLMKIMRG